jgi:hypothetical protein
MYLISSNGREGFKMSSGPTLTGETCIEVTGRGGYVNVQVEVEDWCTYKGECRRDIVVFGKDLCYHCIYKKPVDVPALIDEAIKRRDK